MTLLDPAQLKRIATFLQALGEAETASNVELRHDYVWIDGNIAAAVDRDEGGWPVLRVSSSD